MANIRIAELDFDEIKQNLKTFLNAQSEFTDYDFEGSGLSVLIDLLAYNTHYNAYLANMLFNEMFLDSAVKRASAVSLAKHVGYTPRSVRGARATLNVTVNNPTGLPATLTMDRYTTFTTTVNGSSYTFVNTEPYTTTPVGTAYSFNNVRVTEGSPLEFSFVVTFPGPAEKYEIPNLNVDTSTVRVTVQKSESDTTTTVYTLASDLSILDGASTVFFIDENPFNRYEVYFGDGILGKKLEAGNIVRVQYLISNGEATNSSSTFSQSFTAAGAIAGSTSVTVDTVSNSSGGADKEGIREIKFNAPLFAASQNRAVTAQDFKAIIRQIFAGAESITVWGGEDNDPPAYGKVFISLKPTAGFIISESDKTAILNGLRDKQIITIIPEFVDPTYTYVNIECQVRYNPNLTTLSSSQIRQNVYNAIETYFDETLQKFEKDFYYSELSEVIGDVNPSIISNTVTLALQKRISPQLNTDNSFILNNSLKFNNRLHPGELESTRFYISVLGVPTLVQLRDTPSSMPPDYSGTGEIILINALTGTTYGAVGTINYATGNIDITNIRPTGYPSGASDIRITCRVQEESRDIITLRNNILTIDDSTLDLNINRQQGLVVNITPVTK